MVITLASHARGPGFDPQRNHCRFVYKDFLISFSLNLVTSHLLKLIRMIVVFFLFFFCFFLLFFFWTDVSESYNLFSLQFILLKQYPMTSFLEIIKLKI